MFYVVLTILGWSAPYILSYSVPWWYSPLFSLLLAVQVYSAVRISEATREGEKAAEEASARAENEAREKWRGLDEPDDFYIRGFLRKLEEERRKR